MKTKNVLKRLLGGALAFVMALGIFAGTGMEAKAAEPWSIEPYTPPENLSFNDLCLECIGDFSTEEQIMEAILFASEQMSTCEGNWMVLVSYTAGVVTGITGNGLIQCTRSDFNTDFFPVLSSYAASNHCYILSKNSTSGGEAASSGSHTHSYSWVPVQEATVRQAGIAEYRCSCGDVQGRSVIPASTAAVKGLINEIENAPQNETATFDTGWLYTISDHIIKKLAERTDITTVITFEYQNQAYKMTIPAGADFTFLLADEEYFYGYFFFANAVGATIEAL